jgi:hypothetical protein
MTPLGAWLHRWVPGFGFWWPHVVRIETPPEWRLHQSLPIRHRYQVLILLWLGDCVELARWRVDA